MFNRRRKVRCNEASPRCSHCQRLNLECKWRTAERGPSTRPASPVLASNSGRETDLTSESQEQNFSTNLSGAPYMSIDGHFNDVFNYASFMWDSGDVWNLSTNWSEQESNHIDQPGQIEFSVCYLCHRAWNLLCAYIDLITEHTSP